MLQLIQKFSHSIINRAYQHQATNFEARSRCSKKIAALAVGIFTSPSIRLKMAHTNTHSSNAMIQHALDEILTHAIWEKGGHYILGLGSFSCGLLGGIFTFQTLGEEDGYHIPQFVSKPTISQDINPNTGKFEDCLILPNGKKIYGQDILRFCQELQCIQIKESLSRQKKS